jgi:uncharacterized membrane protein (DUF2068 family)
MAKNKGSGKKDRWLLLIGAAKCLKGCFLLFVGLGALKLLHRDAPLALQHWIEEINLEPDNQFLAHWIQKLGTLSQHKKLLFTAGTFLYSGLFLTEGIGLLLRKHWAEYFAVIVTASFLPLEIFELIKHFSAIKVLVIVLNAAIVAYLVWKLKSERHKGPSRRRRLAEETSRR